MLVAALAAVLAAALAAVYAAVHAAHDAAAVESLLVDRLGQRSALGRQERPC